jgi:alkylation response protein AidB-like acyl-CoA dehydrogenase
MEKPMHNLQLNEDQTMIVETVRKFVADSVAPHALELDEHRKPVTDEFGGLAELGLFGLPVGEAAGGVGMGLLPFVASVEEVALGNGSLARLLIEQVQCALALEAAGRTDELEGIVGGATRVAFVGPEHHVTHDGNGLRGTAELVPGAAAAEWLVVAAGDKLFLCAMPGCKVDALPTLGLASASPARVTFAGSKATEIGSGAAAQAAVGKARLAAWLGGAAMAVGRGTASIMGARKHAGERIAFGKPLLAQQAVARKLVECRRLVDAARQLAWHGARIADLGEDATETALHARISAVDAAVLAADEGIQIHGGYGYTVEYHVERHYRDAKTLEVLDAGNDALKDLLAARL